jgi:hypothetical protein
MKQLSCATIFGTTGPRSNGEWDHADKLLLTIRAIAAAHHNAIGRA